MYQEDWLLRQITLFIQQLARTLLHKTADELILESASGDDTRPLLRRLLPLVDQGRLNEAENLLFDCLDPDDPRTLEAALVFYARLNALPDEALARSNFSREEIDQGLRDAAAVFSTAHPILF